MSKEDKIFLAVGWIFILLFIYLFWSTFLGWLLK
mgnify:CR=1 FL=1